MGREWAGQGRHSGARMHAGAPEATALIGNVIAPDRLRVLAFADDAAEMPNLTMCDRENWPTTLRQNASAPILTTAPR